MYLWLLAGTGWGGKGTSFPRWAGGCACQNVPTQRNVHWLCLTPHGCELTWAFASTPILSPLWKFGPRSLIHHCSAYKCTKCWECFGFFLNYNCNWLFPFSLVYFFSQRCLALHCDCMLRPDVSFMTMSHGLLLWFLPRPQIHHMLPWLHKTNQTKYIYAPPSCMSLPWFPSESAHDARCYAHHCVCSNNSCHQRPLRCNSYRQSGLALSMAFFHVFRSWGPGEGWIPCGVERRPRLGAGWGAQRQRVRACVRPGVREGLLPPAGWAQARPERRDGRLAGAQALLQKHTSPGSSKNGRWISRV